MKTRLIAGIVAVVLSIVGTVVLVGYVRGADSRAMAGLETVDLLVAEAAIPEGTAATELTQLVTVKQLPAAAVLAGRVTGLDQLVGQVALVALQPGEQLLANKFGPLPSDIPEAVVVPPEMQQVTVLLGMQQALGGQIKAGDTVGMFLSVTDAKQTHLTAHNVLVTLVQAAPSAAADSPAPTSGATTGPTPTDLTGSLLITVATAAPIAEKIVFAATFGSIWLSNEPLTADESGTQILDGTLVFK